MSSSKSLGSSPIGLKSEKNSMAFIPDHGVSRSKKSLTKGTATVKTSSSEEDNETVEKSESSSKKQVVSYSLEKGLVKRLKSVAEEQGIYYSTLVGKAIKQWLTQEN